MKNADIWKAKGKGDGRQHAPRIPEPVSIAWKLINREEVREHWTPTGCGLKDIHCKCKNISLIRLKYSFLMQEASFKYRITDS